MENGTVTQPKEKANLAIVGAMPMDRGIVVQTLEEVMSLAKILATSNLIPAALRGNASDVLVVMLKGMELGLKVMQSLNEIYVVNGRPGCSAALKRGLCLQSPACLKFDCIETSDKKATFQAQRKGSEPVRLTWTIEQAATAGLLGKDNWKAHPAAMLRARASSALADLVFPDVVQGLSSTDEMEEIKGNVVSVKVNAPPFSGTVAPPEPTEMELPDEPPDAFEQMVTEQPHEAVPVESVERPKAATAFDKMSAALDEAPDAKALSMLGTPIATWAKNGGTKEEEVELRKRFTARGNDLRKAGK